MLRLQKLCKKDVKKVGWKLFGSRYTRLIAANTFLGLALIGLLLLVSLLYVKLSPHNHPTTHAFSSPPNIVLILTDDETMESVAKMPYLSSRTNWITFDNAFENTSLCCPSRSSILTGQYDTHTGVLDNKGPHDGRQLDEANTLPVWLHQAGYRTALIGEYLNRYPWTRGNYIPPGWDEWDVPSNVPHVYYNYKLNENGTLHLYGATAADYSTDVLASKAADFVNKAARPFFLYFAPVAPHSPFTPAPRHKGKYAKEPVIHDPSFNEADVTDKPRYIQRLAPLSATREDTTRRSQWETMLAVDEAIQKIDAILSVRGIRDNTVEVFMTDNGYAHGEHRLEKKLCPYDVCMRTPLLIHYPGQPARHIPQLVQNIDLAPTFAQLAGVTPGRREDGMSVVPLIEGTAPSWRTELLEHWGGGGTVKPGKKPNFWSIRTDTYRYTELVTGEKELYDYSVDPYELTNKADNPAYAAIQQDLALRLAVLKAKAQSAAVSDTG